MAVEVSGISINLAISLSFKTRGNGLVFLPDPYGFDTLAMPQMFGGSAQLASAT